MQGRTRRVVLALLAGAAACGGGGVDEPAFTAAITGAISRPVAGTAYFGVLKYDGNKRFTVAMEDGTVVGIVLQTRDGSQPTVGTWGIVPNDGVAPPGELRAIVHYRVGMAQEFDGTSGTVTITESTPAVIKGSMTFRGVRTSPCCDAEPVTIDVTGAFVAAQELVTSLR